MKKILALLLALTLALALASCGKKTAGQDDPLGDLPEGVEFLPDNKTDLSQELLGIPGEATLLTVNGKAVTAETYLYWLGNMTSYYEMLYSYSNGGGELDLTQEVEPGVTWDQQLKEVAYQNSVLLSLTPDLAAEKGIALDEAELQELVDQRASNIESVGGEEQYAYQLQVMGISDAAAFRLDRVSALFSKLQETCLADTAAVTDADVDAYVAENDLLRAKHILLLTKDMTTGEAYDQETQAAQRAKADDLLAQLRSDPDQFDALMNANSEDTGLAGNPDGYVFSAGDMVAEFEQGTRDLEIGEISEVIQSDYGYHIILRLDPDCDETRQQAAEEVFNDMIQSRIDGATVEKAPEYDTFTTQDYYDKLLAFQESLPEPEVKDQSQATLEPAESGDPGQSPAESGDPSRAPEG